MKTMKSFPGLVAGAAIALALPAAATDHYDDAFPPPVIAGVTHFPQAVPEVQLAQTEVPPNNIWGVTRFPETVDEAVLVDSAVPRPVVWARWGVTVEAAEREVAVAKAASGVSAR